MKDPGKAKFYLGLQIEYLSNRIFVLQSTYTKKVMKHLYMDNTNPLNTPMVVRSLDAKKDLFLPLKEDEEILGPKIPYLNAIEALMYLANCTRLDIAFAINLLARYNSTPIKKHWNEVKYILRYFHGTTKMRLFYSESNS
jgi:hypothetical protein